MDNPTPLTLVSYQKLAPNLGRNIALVMALKKDNPSPSTVARLPRDASAIRKRLGILAQEINSNHADLLELLVRFDDLKGWKCNGSKHCAAWMNSEIGISVKSSWEYLRVGRKLRTLRTLQAFFGVGKISWSKVRLISRVADENNELVLCHAALDASVSDVERLCKGYRWSTDENNDAENTQAVQQWNSRSFTWNENSNGSTSIQITLPPESAQAFLNSVEQSLNMADTAASNMSQRRADAAVLMAEKGLQSAGREIATADRYQVIVSVDASELTTNQAAIKTPINPKKRARLTNANPTANIAKETARRIACDCSVSVNQTSNGEPVSIGRKSRIWPAAMARAIKDRDQVCVWPGCMQSRHLHIHHIKHWADGGETSAKNGACLCSYHHTMVHEGGYRITNEDEDSLQIVTQYIQQLNTEDTNQFDFEKTLRGDWDSFTTVRALMPSTYRFRIADPDGKDVMEYGFSAMNESTRSDCREPVSEYNVSAHCCTRYERNHC